VQRLRVFSVLLEETVMPLGDHFHLPWSEQNPWEGFHSAWVNTLVRHLNGHLLPRRYRAVPQVHLGPYVEADVATYDREPLTPQPLSADSTNGGAAWTSAEMVQTLEIDLPTQDVFEVRIHDEERGRRLVAAVELVSPGNKDRAESRQAFVTKCAAYLQEQVNLLIVDAVTSRRANFHRELLEQFDKVKPSRADGDLYCVSYRNRNEHNKWQVDFWPYALTINAPLPIVPLWLAADFHVPLDLEKAYVESCEVLRIE
jgi:hypothetical protein